MNLACAMGIPAPKFISYGSLDSKDHFTSILMTRMSGRPLDTFKSDEINLDSIKRELIRILTRMRSFASPWDEAVCGVAGGPICGPLIPGCPLSACANEEAFQQSIREITSWDRRCGEEAEYVRQGEEFFALPRHAIVFTHGDLNNHNIMIGQDGRISGIVDWEAAAWLPDYWEVSVTAILSRRPWGRFLNEQVTSGVYQKEVEGHRAIFPLIANSLSY
ncbi:hypothetical protein VKT23_008329 [Stygiomarasmius scandens]|uniref:Aminoglycoside phosphotransferase domain-containing protein n=1 Tax=Marasmiellus scandens TaxID=2682957 RepID=A0ABR1JIS4_9AGAR